MKIHILSSFVALSLVTATAHPNAHADNLAVLVSPNGEAEAKKAEIIKLLQLITGTVEVGETATIFNGLNGQTLCTFSVPDRQAYVSEKAKLNANRTCIGHLMNFAEHADLDGRAGALNLPGALRMIATNASVSDYDTIVIVGSPIYDDAAEGSVSMADGFVPSDGYITAPATVSPYSMSALKSTLSGTPVHFSWEGYDWPINTRHKDAVQRFWALSIETLGGSLATFNADFDQLAERVRRDVKASPETFERSSSPKLEMIQIQRDRGRHTPIHERQLSDTPLSESQMRRATDVEVGINWSCECDMDIYVRPNPQAEVLFFGHKRTNEGQFYRDYRNGRDLLNGLESVRLDAPVDLDELVLGVNFYSGDAPGGVSGEIRLSVGDDTYATAFSIEVHSGNEGLGANEAFATGGAPNDHWVLLTGREVVAD